jgi:nucleotide-binding universal stress UspA family protein
MRWEDLMAGLGDKMPVQDKAPVTETLPVTEFGTSAHPIFGRVLIAVEDAKHVERAVELARRAGATEARVLHLNLRENIRGMRFPLETEAAASYVVEAAVFELQMAGIPATGVVQPAIVDRAAEAIVAEAADWNADLIVLGGPRRGEFATRLLGSVTLRALVHAPCPVLVADYRSAAQAA